VRPRWQRRLVGTYLEIRVIPVMLWSFAGIALGTALAADRADLALGWFAAAVAIGVLLQGVVAHTVNEIGDWRSGTDADPAPRLFSGGSKVVAAGLLGERELAWLGASAGAGAVALGFVVAAHRGWWLLAFGAVGLVGAAVYTLPPIRAAYRPFAGELVAFVCVWACVAGGYGVQTGALTREAAAVGVAHGAYCVSMLMLHHYLDRGPDARAIPPKITSVVRLGGSARRYGAAWSVVAAGAAATATGVDVRMLPLVVAALIAVTAHLRVRPDDPASVTFWEALVIGAGITAALVAATLRAPELAWLVAVPVVLAPVELAVARRYLAPETPSPELSTG
jgi:1,4-dihydroxy-2-naphthoate octaprenyltransferase